MFCVKLFFICTVTVFAIVNCYVTATEDKRQDAKCLLPMEPGPCRMSLTRFYYNAKTDSCEEFKFGGCKGNDNKFGFKQTCEAACKKSTATSTPKTTATSKVLLSTTTEKNSLVMKQLRSDTLKTLSTNGGGSSTTTTTTTVLPDMTRTAAKSKVTISTTPRGSRITTTQKSTRF